MKLSHQSHILFLKVFCLTRDIVTPPPPPPPSLGKYPWQELFNSPQALILFSDPLVLKFEYESYLLPAESDTVISILSSSFKFFLKAISSYFKVAFFLLKSITKPDFLMCLDVIEREH